MAQPITKIVHPARTEKELQEQSLEAILTDLAKSGDGIREMIKLFNELHESGILGSVNGLVEAKEKVAGIAVEQLLRPQITNAINNMMAAAGALSDTNPDMTKKLMGALGNGLEKAEKGLEANEKVGVFDLMKALKDPDINRAIGFGLNLLKGVGEGLNK
ncbi:DUF1641 domain-containing protein [Fictibacillus enclensis]|uniref:DUF1641 domain-containing protein n=1 Tax=Fictibacillus enclensis TaxID=1017270 RepID=A0A0V8J9G5_9BACL|nr:MULTISPECIES: DUF1641 domain-containing protein [Fictibacillus]KSU83516.1 hypothetical protein AS030_13230 [Fictibacillus enclensis]MDM5200235.1 DUF1641 domain-containing protein [Fictibacillus enclensis]MDM5339564.1 DUF1641 domain-containing protein [Fictibacillus enclensis]RXZ02336.1 DUF1641 domain-containing protein [Fictibacillus sp. S7]SCC16762.1 Uncharacterized conserved protein YjgD, DUF1641 family [Fictibacillus enclensis]